MMMVWCRRRWILCHKTLSFATHFHIIIKHMTAGMVKTLWQKERKNNKESILFNRKSLTTINSLLIKLGFVAKNTSFKISQTTLESTNISNEYHLDTGTWYEHLSLMNFLHTKFIDFILNRQQNVQIPKQLVEKHFTEKFNSITFSIKLKLKSFHPFSTQNS